MGKPSWPFSHSSLRILDLDITPYEPGMWCSSVLKASGTIWTLSPLSWFQACLPRFTQGKTYGNVMSLFGPCDYLHRLGPEFQTRKEMSSANKELHPPLNLFQEAARSHETTPPFESSYCHTCPSQAPETWIRVLRRIPVLTNTWWGRKTSLKPK